VAVTNAYRLVLAPESRTRTVVSTVAALAATAGIVAVIVGLLGANPATAFDALIEGALGSKFSFGQTVMITSILALTGLAAAIPFSARLWNVGGEGQLYMGAFIAAASALSLPASLPHWLFAPIVVVLASAGGAIWGFIPGVLKATLNANEVITSLMLGFMAILFAEYGVIRLWPQGTAPQTEYVPESSRLPNIWTGTLITAGAPIALLGVVVAYLIMERTALGFQIRATGLNERTARMSGMSVGRTRVLAFTVGGAFAGLAGSISVLGMNDALVANFSANFGFIGIAVALLARLRPIWILPSAFFFAILRVGSNGMQAETGLSPTVGELLVTTFVILLLVIKVVRLRYAEHVQ
jgi:simple sugar transport system permease protein